MAETISVQMKEILEEYNKRVKNASRVAIQRVGRESVKKLRNTSPKKTGSYASGWRVKKLVERNGVTDVVVHNATDYQLTHLLENGHIVRNKREPTVVHQRINTSHQWKSGRTTSFRWRLRGNCNDDIPDITKHRPSVCVQPL